VSAGVRSHRYADVTTRTERRIADQVRALVLGLADVDDETALRYAASHARLVHAGQLVEVRLASAYAASIWGAATAAVPPSAQTALDGVLVTAETPTATSPILRVRHLLAEGQQLAQALDTASGYAANLATADLQAAKRVALDTAATTHRRSAVRWLKLPSGDACDWCQLVAGQTYAAADSVPFHAGCTCGVAPDEGEA